MNNLNEYELSTELTGESGEFEQEGEAVNEMMSVSNEMEFENFLGNVWDAAKRLYNSPQGQAIKKDFITGAKSFGRKMFPSIGRNLGGYFGGRRGARYGGQIAGAAGNWLLGETGETEAVDYTRIIRKAANYLNKALAKGGAALSVAPRVLVTKAINKAAQPVTGNRQPGQARLSLPSRPSAIQNYPIQKQGQWIRKGNSLVLQGAS